MKKTDSLIFAVPHNDYIEDKNSYLELLNDNGLVIDIKGLIKNNDLKYNQTVWRL